MAGRAFPAPRAPLQAPPQTWMLYWTLRILLGSLFRVRVQRAGSVPVPGPYVLIANHISLFDPLLLTIAFPLQPRIWFLAAAGRTIAVPWRRRLLQAVGGMIPIYEHSPASGRRALRIAERVLRKGAVVGIFPEGAVGPEEGRLQPLHPGAVALALRTGVPILPVWIAGAGRVYWRRPIQIIVGEPFWPPAGVPLSAATASLSGALKELRARVEPVAEARRPRGLWLNRLL